MGMLHSANVWNKHSQFFGHGKENLIIVIIVFTQERNQLLTGPLLAKSTCNS
ncbi:hypothetical protein LINGRAHAP2_LOCUS11296 [Linum grandiflorum]